MPHTIIKVKTFMCPHGLGNEDAECRFHRAFNNLTVDGLCPDCHVPLEKATLDDDRITMTVMGEEEIESEIEERTEETYRTHRLDEIAREVESIDDNGDFPTSIARDKFKAQREADVEDRIIFLKDKAASDPNGPTFRPQGYFLTTLASITNYRTKRLADISKAITKARELEDVEDN